MTVFDRLCGFTGDAAGGRGPAAGKTGGNGRMGGLAVLVDPVRTTPSAAREIALRAAGEGVGVLLLGTSFGADRDESSAVARALKGAAPEMPLLQFPATATQLAAEVDALLFLSLVSGRNPQYLIEEHVRAVPFVERNPHVEVISTAYCLIDGGVVTTVESVSQTRPLPADKPELVAAHVRAAALIGMRATYLDAGSGATRAVSPTAIAAARGAAAGPLFVGGGIRTPEGVRMARDAGADFVVVGTLFEEQGPRLVSGLAHAARA
ncbi:MAG TPA: geranylgeranylglyceryl/heptaprenylglyceryl phosphate synthase [Gemmatimonadaceae bacterium]|nr:geranylgeranylglyceryl/heptaprenylglyceryl phosphate synthase [Gemmatimonadaceae bacterium]